ncbi:MAG TPA: hypothetical protein VF407_15305 [Polyangiaceae bacterium]
MRATIRRLIFVGAATTAAACGRPTANVASASDVTKCTSMGKVDTPRSGGDEADRTELGKRAAAQGASDVVVSTSNGDASTIEGEMYRCPEKPKEEKPPSRAQQRSGF